MGRVSCLSFAATLVSLISIGCGRINMTPIVGPDAGCLPTTCPPFSPDPTFGQDGVFVLHVGAVDNLNWTPQGLAVEPDGRIVLGGTGGSLANQTFVALRLLDDGTLDPTFGAGGVAEVDLGYVYEFVQSVRLQPDAKIVLVGQVSNVATDGQQIGVARLLADGSPDPTFATVGWRSVDVLGGADIVNGMVPLGDGRLRLCGQGWTVQPGPSDLVVYGLLADGSIETVFGAGGVLQIDFFGGDEFGVLLLERDELSHQLVVVGVGDLGTVEHEVAVRVVVQLLPELLDADLGGRPFALGGHA